MHKPLARAIARNLDDAIHRLDADLERVEIWTAALAAFLKPIPGYDADPRFLLPGAKSAPESSSPERPTDQSGAAVSSRSRS
jgi:hypothetical protein